MATKTIYVCGRCGAASDAEQSRGVKIKITQNEYEFYCSTRQYDLCYNCYNKFNEFLENQETQHD